MVDKVENIQNRDGLRYSQDVKQIKKQKQEDQNQDSLRYTQIDDNQTINYDWLQEKLQEKLSQILQEKQKGQYRDSLKIDKQKMNKTDFNKQNRKKLFQKYKKGITLQQRTNVDQSKNIQNQFDQVFDSNKQSFTSRFLEIKKSQLINTIQQQHQTKQSKILQGNQKQLSSQQTIQQMSVAQPLLDKQLNSLIIQDSITQSQNLKSLLQEQQDKNYLQSANNNRNDQHLEKKAQSTSSLNQNESQQIKSKYQINDRCQIKQHNFKDPKQKLKLVIIVDKMSKHNHQAQDLSTANQMIPLNQHLRQRSYQSKQKTNILPSNNKPKVIFKYKTQNESKNCNFAYNNQKSNQNQIKKPTYERKDRVKIMYFNSTIEQIVPVFMQRLRKLNSYLPNLNREVKYPQTIINQLKSIIQNVSSALTFLQLLSAKIIYKIQSIAKFKLSMKTNSSQYELLQQFLNGNWKQIQNLTQIQYIKPKQPFKSRQFVRSRFIQGINNFRQNCKHYLNYKLNLQSKEGIFKYMQIRTTFFKIDSNIKLMSQDLYGLWLCNCHFPYQYKIFYTYLLDKGTVKQNKQNIGNLVLSHLLQLEDLKDQLSLSYVGKIIKLQIQKEQQNKIKS